MTITTVTSCQADDVDGGDGGLSAIKQQRIGERKRNHLVDVLCM